MRFVIGILLGLGVSLAFLSSSERRDPWIQRGTDFVEYVQALPEIPVKDSAAETVADGPAAYPLPAVQEVAETAPGLQPPLEDSLEDSHEETATPVIAVTETIATVATSATKESAESAKDGSPAVPDAFPGTPTFQVAWSPFRSETSARGFASNLNSQLDEQFRVVRRGPGRYEVGFDYRTEAERQEILSAILAFTGYAPVDSRSAKL